MLNELTYFPILFLMPCVLLRLSRISIIGFCSPSSLSEGVHIIVLLHWMLDGSIFYDCYKPLCRVRNGNTYFMIVTLVTRAIVMILTWNGLMNAIISLPPQHKQITEHSEAASGGEDNIAFYKIRACKGYFQSC